MAINSINEANSIFAELNNTIEKTESIFLLAEAYFIIGSKENFNKQFLELKKIIDNQKISAKIYIILKIFKLIKPFSK